MQPLLSESVETRRAGENRVAPLLAAEVTGSLVPTRIADLERRGVQGVKLVSREALERVVAERVERAVLAERVRVLDLARGEARTLAAALRESQDEAAALARRGAALESERNEARGDAREARRSRDEALRQMAEAEGAFEGARRAARAAEERAAEAVAGRASAEAREREARATQAAIARLESRLRSIEAALGRSAERVRRAERADGSPARAVPFAVTTSGAGATPTAAWVTGSEHGIPSKYGPGVKAGLRPGDPRFEEKSGILQRLVRENLQLRDELRDRDTDAVRGTETGTGKGGNQP